MEHEPRTFSDSITVAAPPDEVYAVVSDVTRTGEWSPVCQDCWWDEGDGPHAGAHFTGRNVLSDRTWETRSQVTAADPGRRFTWSVGPGRVEWGYVLEPAGPDGSTTELTETWTFTTAGRRSSTNASARPPRPRSRTGRASLARVSPRPSTRSSASWSRPRLEWPRATSARSRR